QTCNSLGNAIPYCSPLPNDVWSNGTVHTFEWNSLYPYYSSSDTLDLYLYYKENLQYRPIKNWTALPCNVGSWTTQVDDSWFPVPLYSQSQKKWIMYGYYLPSSTDPKEELSNPASRYPRPFNFTVLRK
ncbi:uncharacterized protein BX664DRAFT_239848, partial [Halteromyces radiatus]|uniref:uncharacterized protein n=1 Tax=Halteromyces radiatus TaxID=101107 RepID=UPI0022207C88